MGKLQPGLRQNENPYRTAFCLTESNYHLQLTLIGCNSFGERVHSNSISYFT